MKALKEIHLLSGAINALTIAAIFIFKRPANYLPYLILSIPLVLSQIVIEKSGRPVYGPDKRLARTPMDLSQAGLTEYLFDVIYFTLICDLLVIVLGSNKVWYLYLAIPGFAGYKIFTLVSYGRNLLGGGKPAVEPQAAEEAQPQEEVKSKRQQKLEARGGKKKIVRG